MGEKKNEQIFCKISTCEKRAVAFKGARRDQRHQRSKGQTRGTERSPTFGICCVTLARFCPFLPMMKRWSQEGADTEDTVKLLA